MSTNSAGSPSGEEVAPEPSTPDEHTPVTRRHRVLVILSGAVVLLLGIYMLTNVIGVLYAIIFPAQAPLPPDVVELSHDNPSYGVDTWLYGTQTDACELIQYFQDQGGQCRISPYCSGSRPGGPITSGENIGRCSANVKFSIFAMHWEVNIAGGYTTGQPTQFQLSREVYWTGAVPPQPDLPVSPLQPVATGQPVTPGQPATPGQ